MQEQAIIQLLEQAGLRITSPRRAVVRAVAERRKHFDAEEIVSAVRRAPQHTGRATVFRTLETLVSLGLVERVDLPAGGHAYVTCQPNGDHHHHVVCSSCGRSASVGEHGLAPLIAEIEATTGYQVDLHRLELFGVCPSCRVAATSQQLS